MKKAILYTFNIKAYLSLFFILFSVSSFAQYTYTTQPNAANGKDAIISESNTSNLGSNHQLWALAWTYGGSNIGRGLVQFDLTPIPSTAIITDARLSLWAWNQSGGAGPHSQYQGDNSAYIERIVNSWQEMTVLWTNKPGTTTLHRDSIPGTTNPALDYPNIEVTQLVIDMIQYGNYGFMLRQKIESPYHLLNFCSSDYQDTTKHPKLVVSYFTMDMIYTNVSCHGQTDGTAKVVLGGNPSNITYKWSNGAITDSIGNLSPGTYFVTVHYSASDSLIDTISISEPPPLLLSTSNGAVICQGESTQIWALANGNSIYSYFWSNNLPDTSHQIVSPTISTLYSVFAIDSNNCPTDTSTIIIAVNPKPQPSLGADRIIFKNDSLELYPGLFNKYLWSTGDTTPSILVYGNILSIGNHKYIVEVEDNNCSAKDSMTISIVSGIDSKSAEVPFKIFPNPARNWLNISNEKSIFIKRLLIYDIQGRLIKQELIESKSINISCSIFGYEKATYILVIETRDSTKKLTFNVN